MFWPSKLRIFTFWLFFEQPLLVLGVLYHEFSVNEFTKENESNKQI